MPTTRLTRASRLFHGLAVASMVLLPALIFVGIILPGRLGIDIQGTSSLPNTPWPANIWAGLIVSFIPLFFSMLALNGMRHLFALYRFGDPLAPQAGPIIKSIDKNVLIASILGVVLYPAVTGLISLSNPVGERSISVSISINDIGFILVAGLLLMIGWSMSEATKVAAENREFI